MVSLVYLVPSDFTGSVVSKLEIVRVGVGTQKQICRNRFSNYNWSHKMSLYYPRVLVKGDFREGKAESKY
jgi:hypothetical protein